MSPDKGGIPPDSVPAVCVHAVGEEYTNKIVNIIIPQELFQSTRTELITVILPLLCCDPSAVLVPVLVINTAVPGHVSVAQDLETL